MLRTKQDLVVPISTVSIVPFNITGQSFINNETVSEDQKKNFRENKEVYATYIKEIEQELNQRFKFVSAQFCVLGGHS